MMGLNTDDVVSQTCDFSSGCTYRTHPIAPAVDQKYSRHK